MACLTLASVRRTAGRAITLDSQTPYSIHLEARYAPLELIDIQALVDACRDPWYNQTLCRVNDCVVRLGVMQGEFHWHKHDEQDEFFYVVKSVRRLAAELRRQGHATSHRMVAELLHDLDYSLQANAKTMEGASHPDRNAQFEYINTRVRQYLGRRDPVISVDTKKKELVGRFKNGGREWRPRGQPEKVQVHDFVTEQGRAIPYGVYDLGANTAWVSVGITHDTAEFAVATIRRWWQGMGQRRYPKARRLLITAEAGGSNGARLRLWKTELQKLADVLHLPIAVSHFPPGTSKWNKIEHKLFSFISQNWRGKPLISHAVIVKLIAATRTTTGLTVRARLDHHAYPKGIKISQAELDRVRLRPDTFHGDWNYTILPTHART